MSIYSLKMKEIFDFLNSIHPISSKLADYLIVNLKPCNVKKGTILLKEGQVCSTIFFITKGLVRSYYLKDNIEISSWFMKEGDIIISVESFFTQKPSYEYLHTLEDCELWGISYQDLDYIYHNLPEFNFIGRVLTEKYYIKSELRLYNIRKQKGKDRYSIFMTNEPDLIRRIPSKYIASHLGLSIETLSRLRSK